MKIDRLDAHDRLKQFVNQDFDIGACCQDIINKAPFGNRPFYIFAHARTLGIDERFKLFSSGVYSSFETVPEKTIIWQPRLTKPKAQTNSMLFKGHPGTDIIRIVWMIPDRALWPQYRKGNLTQNETVYNSIQNFLHNRDQLEAPEDEDASESEIDSIYTNIAAETKRNQLLSRLYTPA